MNITFRQALASDARAIHNLIVENLEAGLVVLQQQRQRT